VLSTDYGYRNKRRHNVINIRMLDVRRLTFQYIFHALRAESVLAKLMTCLNKLILNLKTVSDVHSHKVLSF
jgi:hypothetical protein